MDTEIIVAIIGLFGAILYLFATARINKTPEAPGESSTSTPPKPIDTSYLVGIGLISLCALLFALQHVVAKYVINVSGSPAFSVAVRNLVSGAFIIGIAFVARCFSKERSDGVRFDLDSWVMVGGRCLSGLCYFSALVYLTATEVTSLYKLNPIYTLVILVALAPLKAKAVDLINLVIGTFIAVLGALVVVANPSSEIGITLPWVGVILMVLAGIFWSLFIVASRRHESTGLGKAPFWQRQQHIGLVYLYGAVPVIILFVARLATGQEPLVQTQSLIPLVFLGLLSGAIGLLYFEALKRISALLASIIVGFEIFFTIVIEKCILGEPVTLHLFVGAALVMVGAVGVSRETRKLQL